MRFWTEFLGWMVSLLPSYDVPAWLSSSSSYMSNLWTYGYGLGAWIPWPLVGTVLASVLACVLIGFGIKVARIVASFMTLGGGGAG